LSQHPDRFRPSALTARSNSEALEALVDQWRPDVAVLTDAPERPSHRTGATTWLYGRPALLEMAADPRHDIVLNALVGAAGIEPTLAALRAGHRVALANKESLVCGGSLVLRAAAEGGGELFPVDSEHSAIHQCLAGGGEVERLILTASGGPFREFGAAGLATVQPVDALRHPTWDM